MAVRVSTSFRRRIPPAIVACAIGALGVLLFLVAFLVIRAFDDTRELRAEARRSYETRIELQNILALHQDLETAQRGFQITGSPQFLEPYSRASREIDATFARLRNALLVDSPLRSRVPGLQRLSDEKRGFVAEVISLVEQGDMADAQRRVAGARGKQIMDAFRSEIVRLEADERAQLAERTRQADAAFLWLQRLIMGVITILFLIIAAAVLLALRSYGAGREALARLEDGRGRIAAILNGAKDGMIVLDSGGSIDSLNPAAAEMYGYREEELLGRDVGMLLESTPDRARVETYLDRVDGQQTGNTPVALEFTAARRDGSVFPVEVTVSPIRQGGRAMFLAIMRDVSERKRIERMKDEFVSTVSHELRTPLTSIAGSLGLLAGGAAGDLPERALRLIEIARTNSARLVRLINDILDIEKIQSGKMRFDLRPVPLAPFLEQAVQANGSFAAEYGIDVAIDPVPRRAAVLGDEDWLMQVLENLLSNAVKFSPRGETVRISVRPTDRGYRISVADRGVGIGEGFREIIFSKFAQEDASISRRKGGTGLGLSIVKEIVTRMHGSVGFESEVGKGTVFHVDLPRADDGEDAAGAPLAPEAEPLGDRPHLLHVDDDRDMLGVVASAFGDSATVRPARTLEGAREALAREKFAAVVLDIGMEGGSGLELVPLVRGNSPGTPIVVFTAQDVTAAQLDGVDAVLVKSRASLDRLVADVLRLAEAASEDKA